MQVLLLILIVFVLYLLFKKFILGKFKSIQIGSVALITGGVKTGKSTLSVHLTIKEYKCRLRQYKIKKFILKLFGSKRYLEMPLIYSNIPLNCDYVPLTEDLILRKKRFAFGSVVYVNEASLLADSQLIKDKTLNDRLLLFNKLIGHELKGGIIIYDTQCLADLHYSIKRIVSNYFYIHHLTKVPFFIILYVREMQYSADNDTINVFNEDVTDTLKRVIISKKVWNTFDSYCYSILTDNLQVENNVIHKKDIKTLKADKIISFKGVITSEKENN